MVSLWQRICFEHFEFQASIWFFIASFGYATFDIIFGFLPLYCSTLSCAAFLAQLGWVNNFLSVFWAVCYLIDGIFYQLSGFFHNKRFFGCKHVQFWADVFNTISALLFVVSQALYFHPDLLSEDLAIFFPIAAVQAWTYFFSLLIWAFNSIQYLQAWIIARREWGSNPPLWRDPYFHVELWNVVPSFGYVGTSLFGLIVMYLWRDEAIAQQKPFLWFLTLYQHNQALQLVINFAWDILFSIDAVICTVLWWKNAGDVLGKSKESLKNAAPPTESLISDEQSNQQQSNTNDFEN